MTGWIQRVSSRFGLTPERGLKVAKFLISGLPAFVLAVPLNYALVEWQHLPKPAAYAIVIVLQVVLNFFLCRFWVFERRASSSLLREFSVFFAGIMLFRLGDWCVYVLLVNVFGLYYLAVQVLNVVLFGLAKFLFSERVLK